MSIALPDTARRLLDGPHTAVLATTNPDGRPQTSVVFTTREGDAVLLSTVKGRAKTRNMQRDPRVSLLVLASRLEWLEVRGIVTITDDPDKALLHEMFDRYMGGAEPPPEPEAQRVVVRIAPDKINLWPPVLPTAPQR